MPLFLKFTDGFNLFLSVVTAPPGVEELKPPGEETSPVEVPKESPKVEEQPKKEGTPPTKVSLRFLCLNDVLLSSSVCSDVHYGRMLIHFLLFFRMFEMFVASTCFTTNLIFSSIPSRNLSGQFASTREPEKFSLYHLFGRVDAGQRVPPITSHWYFFVTFYDPLIADVLFCTGIWVPFRRIVLVNWIRVMC